MMGSTLEMRDREPGLVMELRRVEAERDALAAHLNAPVIDDAIEALGHAQYWQEQEEVESWKAGAPTTSLARMRDERAQAIQQAVKRARMEWARADKAALARLKAQWQAEVLYEFTHGSHVMPAALNLAMSKRAKELRRQAEGGE